MRHRWSLSREAALIDRPRFGDESKSVLRACEGTVTDKLDQRTRGQRDMVFDSSTSGPVVNAGIIVGQADQR